MGQPVVRDTSFPTTPYGVYNEFARASADMPITKTPYKTRFGEAQRPDQWLRDALELARGMGIENVIVKTQLKPDALRYTLYFNTAAHKYQMLTALSGLVRKEKGFSHSFIVPQGDFAEDRAEDYTTAILAFCEQRDIECGLKYHQDSHRIQIDLTFNSNADQYAVQLALERDGTIVKHAAQLEAQRKASQPAIDIDSGYGVSIVDIAKVMGVDPSRIAPQPDPQWPKPRAK